MNTFRTLYRSIFVLFAVVIIAIVTLVHFSLSKIVAEQSRAQQQSLSPAVSLVVDQLLKPLHISEALGKSRELIRLMESDTPDKTAIFEMLSRLENEFGMTFFIAREKNRIQYNSDGSTLALIKGQVSWYFKYKAVPANAVADIGKWEDTHFYIDLKIFSDEGEFLGFFGIGKSLKSFVEVFDQYKQTYGYDFLFVDDTGNIMLSSDPALLASYSDFTHLSELAWFKTLPETVRQSRDLNNRLISIDNKDYLIAEVKLEQFDWTVYLLSPLNARQTEISQGFIFSVVTLLVIVFALFLVISNLLYYFRQDMRNELVIRDANMLPDKAAIEQLYTRMMVNHSSLSIIILGIDEFAVLNDTYTRHVGDEILNKVAAFIQESVRNGDVTGRWSSEEFIILLPEAGPAEALELAKNLRHGIATMQVLKDNMELQITASFGITFSAVSRPLHNVTAYCEDALYQARKAGGNTVKTQLIDS